MLTWASLAGGEGGGGGGGWLSGNIPLLLVSQVAISKVCCDESWGWLLIHHRVNYYATTSGWPEWLTWVADLIHGPWLRLIFPTVRWVKTGVAWWYWRLRRGVWCLTDKIVWVFIWQSNTTSPISAHSCQTRLSLLPIVFNFSLKTLVSPIKLCLTELCLWFLIKTSVTNTQPRQAVGDFYRDMGWWPVSGHWRASFVELSQLNDNNVYYNYQYQSPVLSYDNIPAVIKLNSIHQCRAGDLIYHNLTLSNKSVTWWSSLCTSNIYSSIFATSWSAATRTSSQ